MIAIAWEKRLDLADEGEPESVGEPLGLIETYDELDLVKDLTLRLLLSLFIVLVVNDTSESPSQIPCNWVDIS